MFAAAVPFPVSPSLDAGRGSLVATACRAVLVETSFRAHIRQSAPERPGAIQAPARHKDTTRPRKRREKRAQRANRRSIAEDAFLMAEINLADILERHRDRHRLTLEQKQNAAALEARAQGPAMAIRGKVPLMFSWRAE